MEIDLGKPNMKQHLALMDHHKHVAYGGSRGGGKSWFVRAKAVLLCCNHPGIKVMIIRRTFPELQANHVRPLRELLKIGVPGNPIRHNDQRKEIVFPNGSMILFGYCATDGDVSRYQGAEVDVLFLDEATQLKEEWIQKIRACVRGVNEFPKRIYYTCNPGGIGHAYIKRLFIDKEYLGDERPEEYSFIQSKVYDNEALMASDPEYLHQLEALPEALRKAWLDGDWDSFVGQAFPEWRNNPAGYETRQWSHVINDLEAIPQSWKIYRGFDFGFSKPFSVVWIALDHNERMYLFKEWYGCTKQANTGLQLNVQEIADGIAEREQADPRLKNRQIIGIADPAIWESSHGESIAEMMERKRVYFSKGDHKRLPGKMQFHYRLAFDQMGQPMFYVCKECKQFIRTLPLLIYDEKHVEDIDTEGEDHAYDAVRYVFMDHPINPPPKVEKKLPEFDPLNMWS